MSDVIDISIVIPVLNGAEYLGACLDALDQLEFPKRCREIIVVDNGSTDGSLEIAKERAGVRLLHEPTRGAYTARNRGVAAARGRIIAFTDADCTVAPDWLSRLLAAFDADGADVVVGRLSYVDGAGFMLRAYADYYNSKTRWIFEEPVSPCLYGHGGNMALRAELFHRVGAFREAPIVGDTEILHRLLALNEGVAIQYRNDAVVVHVEVRRFLDMLPKLRSYGRYSHAVSQASEYRPLTVGERLRVFSLCVSENGYVGARWAGLLLVLLIGLVSFEAGRITARKRCASRTTGRARGLVRFVMFGAWRTRGCWAAQRLNCHQRRVLEGRNGRASRL